MDLRQPLKRRRTSLDSSFGIATSFSEQQQQQQDVENQNPFFNGGGGGNDACPPQQQQQPSRGGFPSASSSRHGSRFGSPVPNNLSINNNNNSGRVSPTPLGTYGGGGFLDSSSNSIAPSVVSTVVNRDVEPDTPTERLSRHVPNRDELDVQMSAFNLAGSTSGTGGGGGGAGGGGGGGAGDDDSNGMIGAINNNNDGSFHQQQQSQSQNNSGFLELGADDSRSMYSEFLAEGLVNQGSNSNGGFGGGSNAAGGGNSNIAGTTAGGSDSDGMQRVGSDVLKFGSSRALNAPAASHSRNPSMTPSPHSAHLHFVGGGGASSSGSVSNATGGGGGGGGGASSCLKRRHPSRGGGAGGGAGGDSHKRQLTRALNLNPEKVLDAPDLPNEPCQLLDWGSSNQLVIGLRSTLYCWDASNGAARTVCDIPDDQVITSVAWLRGCHTAAMCQSKTRIALTDMATGVVSRVLLPGIDAGLGAPTMLNNNSNSSSSALKLHPDHRIVNSMSVCGPLIAATTTLGTVCLYDARMPNIAGQFDAHAGGVSTSAFCAAEPHYLATGGSADGSVRLWDYRNTSVARYTFDRIHGGGGGGAASSFSQNNNSNSNGGGSGSSNLNHNAVTALCFFADKRSIVFSGGADGSLLALNTHGSSEDFLVCQAACGPAPITGIVSSPQTGEIATSHGQNGGVVQLRRAYKFSLLGQFSGPGTNAAINCLTMAPDGERVCGAQMDETLKFWKVFDRSAIVRSQQSAAAAAAAASDASSSTAASAAADASSVSADGSTRSVVAPGARIRQRTDDDDEFVDMR